MGKLETSHIETCTVHHLPGRDWYYLIGPLNTGARNLSFGIAEFPGMPHIGVPELIIILVIVLIVFGAGKLADVGGALGRGIREFRKASNEAEEAEAELKNIEAEINQKPQNS